jgi:hypothetical protein
VRLCSPAHMWSLLGFGVFLVLRWESQAFRPSAAPDAPWEVVFLLLALASLGGTVQDALCPALIADMVSVLVRSRFSTERPSWGEVARFRIGRYKLSEATCLIYLKDDPLRSVFAEQAPRLAWTRLDTRKSRVVTELSARIVQPALAQADSRVTR